ncbi:MAG TPA: glycosyltransferase family 1 protein, partial [Gemmataceae bacterium]|nr:glycosyltransferase family 1 protein [Gemmataceae bacterium]
MRILFNLSSALGQRTGIGHYAAELFRRLKRQAAPDQMIGFPTRWRGLHDFLHRVIGRVGGPIRARKERLLAEPAAVGFLPRLWQRWRRLRLADRACVAACMAGQFWMERHYRKCLSPQYSDLYHEPNYIPIECELPAVITVCDLSALLHPHWHPAARVASFEQNFRKGLAQCVHILTISEFSRREIVSALGIAPERITCTYLAPRRGMRPLTESEGASVLRRLGLSWRKYLLYVGTLEPRKNVETLLRAYCDLPARQRERCPLVLAGGWGWRAEGLRTLFESEARPRGVLHIGYVAEADLPALYSGARALAFPSLYEGFGLPPLEMLACGG